jgi:hypothetical protein
LIRHVRTRVLKFSLSVIAVFAVVWIATLLWWQSINRMPTSTADIVTHLFLLPAGMIAAYLVIRGALDGIRRNVVAMRATPAAATEAAQASGELPGPIPTIHAPLACAGAGQRAAQLRSAGAAMTLAALVARRPEVGDARCTTAIRSMRRRLQSSTWTSTLRARRCAKSTPSWTGATKRCAWWRWLPTSRSACWPKRSPATPGCFRCPPQRARRSPSRSIWY